MTLIEKAKDILEAIQDIFEAPNGIYEYENCKEIFVELCRFTAVLNDTEKTLPEICEYDIHWWLKEYEKEKK